MADPDLLIQIGASSKQYSDELDKIRDKTDNLSSQLEGMAVKSGLVFAGLTAAIGLAVEAFSQNEQAGIRTNAILQATGGIADVTAQQVQDLAESLSSQTTFSKAAVQEGENVLLTFTNIGKEVFPQATQASADLAARMGGDVSGAAQMLGRALQDPITGVQMLRRAHITLTDAQKAQVEIMTLSGNVAGAQSIILSAVTNSVGGLAQATAGGTGVFKQLKNVMEELWSDIGAQFAPIVVTAAQHVRDFVEALREHKEVVQLVAAGLAGLTAAVGAIFVVSSLAAIFVAVSTAMAAFGVATSAATLAVIGLAGATGIGLLVAGAMLVYNNWNTIWPQVHAVFESFVVNTMNLLKGLGEMVVGLATGSLGDIKAGFNTLKETLTEGFKKVYQDTLASSKPEAESVGTALGKSLGNSMASAQRQANLQIQAEQKAHNQAMLAVMTAEGQLAILEQTHASDAVIAIKKQEIALLKDLANEKFLGDKSLLVAQLHELQAQYDAAATTELKQQQTLNNNLLKTSAAFQKMSSEQQRLYLAAHSKALLASIETEETANEKNATDQINAEIALHNTLLEKQALFGQNYAAIWALSHSVVLDQTKSAFGELENLTQSHNDTIKTIGKAAAVANIIMKTRDAAMNIFDGFATIPYIGYALGIAGAAAAIAYGAEQASVVLAAAQGGLVTGGIPGQDSVQALLMPGELVVPQQNFNEVVSSVAASRSSGGAPGQGTGGVQVQISLSRDASQFLTVKQNEDKALGISRARTS